MLKTRETESVFIGPEILDEEFCMKWTAYIRRVAWGMASRNASRKLLFDELVGCGFLGLAKVKAHLRSHTGYVSRAVKNTMLTELQKLQGISRIPQNLLESINQGESDMSHEIEAPATDFTVKLDVDKLLAVLPYRELIVMNLVACGYRERDMAETLGLSEEKIRQLRCRALNRLRRYVAGSPVQQRKPYRERSGQSSPI